MFGYIHIVCYCFSGVQPSDRGRGQEHHGTSGLSLPGDRRGLFGTGSSKEDPEPSQAASGAGSGRLFNTGRSKEGSSAESSRSGASRAAVDSGRNEGEEDCRFWLLNRPQRSIWK